MILYFFFFQAEDGIRDVAVTGVQTCALPISCPGLGILEGFALGGHNRRTRICSAPSGVVHGAKRHAGVGLEGRVAAEEDGVADAQASEEATCAGADHGFVVELIGDTTRGWISPH